MKILVTDLQVFQFCIWEILTVRHAAASMTGYICKTKLRCCKNWNCTGGIKGLIKRFWNQFKRFLLLDTIDRYWYLRKTTRFVYLAGQTSQVETLQGPHGCGLSCQTNNECGFPFMPQLNDSILYFIIHNVTHQKIFWLLY